MIWMHFEKMLQKVIINIKKSKLKQSVKFDFNKKQDLKKTSKWVEDFIDHGC